MIDKLIEEIKRNLHYLRNEEFSMGDLDRILVQVLALPKASFPKSIEYAQQIEVGEDGEPNLAICVDRLAGKFSGECTLHHLKMSQEADLEQVEELLPTFTLEAPDQARVLKLCGDMRKIIIGTTDFDTAHKRRLLDRVAAIEKQVHQEKGMLDVVLAGVTDVGETLGKFGKDLKPLTDRMSEINKIARGGSKEYDQIPAPEEIKSLPAPEEEAPE